MQFRILNTIGKDFHPDAQKILNTLGKTDYLLLTQDDLLEEIENHHIVVCGIGLVFSPEVLKKAKKLKLLATVTTGLDHIDIEHAKKSGIKILSLRGENKFLNTITGTAELAVGLMLSLARHLPEAYESVLKGEWDRNRFRGHTLRGQTLGIAGLGRLGTMMARYGDAMGMKVIFADPNVESPNPNWKKVSFETLLKKSDFVTIYVHLEKDTKNMFNKDTFKLMKKTAFLINVSRGDIVNEEDLISALDNKVIAGYATDVLSGENHFVHHDASRHPLIMYAKTHPNVVISPHIGGMTHESRRDTDIFMSEKIIKFIKKNFKM
jgi:D-3-phosphoglycerate dehydrogenase / 2-oxoglutarate reductase